MLTHKMEIAMWPQITVTPLCPMYTNLFNGGQMNVFSLMLLLSWSLFDMNFVVGYLVSWSLTSLFSTNMAISETKFCCWLTWFASASIWFQHWDTEWDDLRECCRCQCRFWSRAYDLYAFCLKERCSLALETLHLFVYLQLQIIPFLGRTKSLSAHTLGFGDALLVFNRLSPWIMCLWRLLPVFVIYVVDAFSIWLFFVSFSCLTLKMMNMTFVR